MRSAKNLVKDVIYRKMAMAKKRDIYRTGDRLTKLLVYSERCLPPNI